MLYKRHSLYPVCINPAWCSVSEAASMHEKYSDANRILAQDGSGVRIVRIRSPSGLNKIRVQLEGRNKEADL